MESDAKTIFIVEDEFKIARFLQMELEHEGFKTLTEQDGRKALDRIVQENADLILLDLMLPGMDGMEICRRLREFSAIPIIMLTARDEVADIVQGLDNGADDYLTKPFAMQELLARIRALFRKQEKQGSIANANELRFKNLVLYPYRHEVTVDGQPVELTKKEYDLLEYMIQNKYVVLKREKILEEVWGFSYMGDTNVVDVYIRYLRKKLDEHFGEKYIHTVRGVGYVVKD
ncbi:MAG TPA: response regulator transcription factor [Syntrophomonadaceae bacterium]|nr:response regulator transcription factor [Syntrophomonadaceae bacterium]